MSDPLPVDVPQPKSIPLWLWAALTVLPIVVSIATTFVTSGLDWRKETNAHTITTRELNFRLIEFGVGVLNAAPDKAGECTSEAAKKWAIGLISKYSEVPFEVSSTEDACKAKVDFTGPSLADLSVPAPPAPASVSGWVALGFIRTGDNLFTMKDGAPLSGGQLPAGTVLRAVKNVNMRPAPAGWGQVVLVIPSGQCVRISETRELPAGAETQTWAAAEIADC